MWSGTWTEKVEMCLVGYGVCGFQTRIEAEQGIGNDSGLNGIRLKCCKVETRQTV